MDIRLKRAYTAATDADGTRQLEMTGCGARRLKEKARVDLWLKAIAPSTELRKWFNHDPAKWEEFC
jgi:uncharacterized protein YeaO (DUF488 family)